MESMENPPFLMVFTRKDGGFSWAMLVSGRVTIEDPGAFLLLVSIRLGVDADNPGGDDHF